MSYNSLKNEIINDSEYLLSFTCLNSKLDITETSTLDDDEIFRLLPFSPDLIFKFYNSELPTTDYELLILINNLSFIGNKYLNDILLFVKYRNSKYFEEKLNEDLLKIYGNFVIQNDHKLTTFVKKGNFYICQWILNNEKHDDFTLSRYGRNYLFFEACTRKHLDIAKLIFCTLDIDIHFPVYGESIFRAICLYTNLDMAQWIYELSLNPCVGMFTIKVINSAFLISCETHNFEIAKWIYSLELPEPETKSHKDEEEWEEERYYDLIYPSLMPYESPDKSKLKIAVKQSIKNNVTHIISNTENSGKQIDIKNAFIETCRSGGIEIAKWLYSLGNIDKNTMENSFILSCSHNKLEIAIWLYSIGGFDIHANEDMAFVVSCEFGSMECAQWLYSLGGVNIHAQNRGAFKKACNNNYLNMTRWLYSIGCTYINEQSRYNVADLQN